MTKNLAALYSYGARLWAASSRANCSNSRSAKEGAHGSTEIKLDNALTETMIIDEELNELAYTEGSATLELASATNTPAPTAAPEQSAEMAGGGSGDPAGKENAEPDKEGKGDA